MVGDKKGEAAFREIIGVMCNKNTDFKEFEKQCGKLIKKFPKAVDWLLWHIHCNRAQHFFPACQNFTEEEHSRFTKLATSTNAQENVGRQFQHLFPCPMSVNEAILCSYKFASGFEADHKSVLMGMPVDCGSMTKKD